MLIVGPPATGKTGSTFRFRLHKVLDRPAQAGWCHLDGHLLDSLGNGIPRTILVRVSGLRRDDQLQQGRRAHFLVNNRGRRFRAVKP
ncbi:hypothetical protein [Krasilnikovia sp. MM14-A1259]|uniref:hypothetical protein n=1 Tax=Krasilnikovia sp. MM14-A1259 TaxID=3373539 RepID=UPI00399D4DBC